MAAVAPAAAPASFASGHYHFSVQGVGRGNGAPVVAKAAYRSGECLYDERIGQMFDYRGGAERVIDSFVMAREDAPAWIQHAAREARQRAWNEAERADPKANARIATELVVGLPHELTAAQRKQLLSVFVLRVVEKYGVFADVSIHTAHDERNIHAHILLSHRELGPEGFGEIANRRMTTRKHRGQVKEMTTAGIAATPADIKKLREQWAQDVNGAYEKAGFDIRVDHRSFEDRGIKDVPTVHLGPTASQMERNGHFSDRGDINRIIEFGNAERQRLEAEKARQNAEIIDLAARLAERQAQDAARGRRDEITPNDDSSRKRRKMAIEREDATDPATIKQQISDQQDFAAQAKEQTELSERFLAGVKRAQEDGEKLREAEQWAGMKAAQEDDIADARSRYAQAAGERYDIRRPYSSLSEVVGLEGAMFQREQEKLHRQAAIERDPDKRELIDLRRQIEANDYMAITSDRLASMSRIITGNGNSEESQRQQQRAEYFAAEALDLRQQRQEVQDRIDRRDSDREMQAIDGRIETVRQWQQKQGGGKAATQQDNSAPETPREAVQAHEPSAAVSQAGQPATRASEAERPAEIIQFAPSVPERDAQPTTTTAAREATDARQAESATAENVEITDVKAAKKAALAQAHAETEQSIAQGQERGYGHSR